MKIYLIRHGDPDYHQVTEAKYKGFGRDLARLTETGIAQARANAGHSIFDEIELVLTSPYTRAMQTTLEMVRFQSVPVIVELLLHEWLPDKTGTKLASAEQVPSTYLDYLHGTNQSPLQCESKEEVYQRVSQVFDIYKSKGYKCIACVTHAVVIRLFTGLETIDFCGIYELNY